MSMSANPQFRSKHDIEGQERAARNIALVVVCLLAAFTALSVTAYQGYSHHAAVCRKIDALDVSKIRTLGEEIIASIETAQEDCQ